MTFIVIVTKTKEQSDELNRMIKKLCHFDHGSANFFGSKEDDVKYMFLSIDKHTEHYLKGRTIDKLYFIMDKEYVPINFVEAIYPMMCSHNGKIIQSKNFNLNLLVS